MKQIKSIQDLQQFGINILTGEACAYSMRILCDLNQEGAALMREYLGLPVACDLAPNWNSQVDGKPAVASIRIERTAFAPLARFALWNAGVQYIYGLDDGVQYTGFDDADVEKHDWLRRVLDEEPQAGRRLYRNPRIPGQPAAGSHNVHAFSGRTL